MALRDYIEALEVERSKMLMFSRELPLSVELITQVIEIRRREMGSDECSYTAVPVLEEFIPLKPSSSSSESEKSDMEVDDSSKVRKPVATVGGAFHLFEKENCPLRPPLAAVGDVFESSVSTENIDPPRPRKRRRCWSPELHQKFLDALERLGGSLSATPKQIRELMKVDRLTNDEVKSHLQKYRLHTKQPSTKTQTPQIPPQFILIGGIWSPTVIAPHQHKPEKQQNQLNKFHSSGDYNNIADHELATKSDSYTISSTSHNIILPFL